MSGSNALNGSLDMLEGCTLSGRLKETWRGQSIFTWYMMAALKKEISVNADSIIWTTYSASPWYTSRKCRLIILHVYYAGVIHRHVLIPYTCFRVRPLGKENSRHRLIWSMCPFIKTHHYIICFVRPRHSQPGMESYCWPSTDQLSW